MVAAEIVYQPHEALLPAACMPLAEIPTALRTAFLTVGHYEWQKTFDRNKLQEAIIAHPPDKLTFRPIRKAGIRYATIAKYFGREHHTPMDHRTLMWLLGQAGDQLCFSPNLPAELFEELAAIIDIYNLPELPEPADDDSYRAYIALKRKSTAEPVAKARSITCNGACDLPIKDFHDMRKILCQIRLIYHLLEDVPFESAVGEITAAFGKRHDDLIVACAGDREKYESSLIAVTGTEIEQVGWFFSQAFGNGSS